jgi:MFS family permease
MATPSLHQRSLGASHDSSKFSLHIFKPVGDHTAMSSSAFTSRNFVVFLVGSLLSLHGVWVYRVALGWLAWELTHSEFWIGVIAFTQFAPAVLLGPAFGVMADRFDRRLTGVIVNACSVVNMLVLAWLTWESVIDIRTLVLLATVQGTLDGAYSPLRMAIVPTLVDDEQRSSAIALGSVAFNLSRFVGPALAGLIIANWGVGPAFGFNGISYIGVILALAVIRLTPPDRTNKPAKHPWLELKEGAHYLFTHDFLRLLLLLGAIQCVLGRGSMEMLPAFADAVYQGGATALAVLTSAIGAGAIVGGIILSRGTHWLTIGVLRIGLIIAGFLIVLLGFVDLLPLAIVVVAMLGLLLSMCGVGSQILMQTHVDDDYRGRVSSFWSATIFGGTALGGLLVGTVASAWDLQYSVIAAGALIVLVIGSTQRSAQRVRE